MDRSRNQYIRGSALVKQFEHKAREARLRWFGREQTRDSVRIGQRMVNMGLPIW